MVTHSPKTLSKFTKPPKPKMLRNSASAVYQVWGVPFKGLSRIEGMAAHGSRMQGQLHLPLLPLIPCILTSMSV
jgi:hypothetical protein